MFQQGTTAMHIMLLGVGSMQSALCEVHTSAAGTRRRIPAGETEGGFKEELVFAPHLSDGQHVMRKLLKGAESRPSA